MYSEWTSRFGISEGDEDYGGARYDIFSSNLLWAYPRGPPPSSPLSGLGRCADMTWGEYLRFSGCAVDPIDLTVKRLREQCRDRGLVVGGTKDDLVERVRAAVVLTADSDLCDLDSGGIKLCCTFSII